MVLEIAFDFLVSNILSEDAFQFLFALPHFLLILQSIISPVSSAENCCSLFLNLDMFEVINLTHFNQNLLKLFVW